jgi:hypothetical protein
MNISEKRKSTSPSAMQVKNQQQILSIEEQLDVISRLEKGEQIGYICHNVRLVHGNVHTVCENADKIAESAKSGTEVFVQQDYHNPIGIIGTKYCGCESCTFLLY